MKPPFVSGFTLVRNGVTFDYPFLESIKSLLPVVDELIINVGTGEDETLDLIQKLSAEESRIKIFESHWPLDDPEKKKGGLILSEQTNLALDRCSGEWCFYLQADEVLHEADYPQLRSSLTEAARPGSQVEGLLFDYVHLYGSYDVEQKSRGAYRREVRAIKKMSGARSVGDAQSFRKSGGIKLNVIKSHARIFHYGWVRTPEAMREKTFFMDQLYHGDPSQAEAQARVPKTGDNFKYKRFWGLTPFVGTHPTVMKDRIRSKGWHWDLAKSPYALTTSDVLKKIPLDLWERLTGIRPFEYRSYNLMGAAKKI